MNYVLPVDPEQRLAQVASDVFGTPWTRRLARAVGVLRQAIDHWPPEDVFSMDERLVRVVADEIKGGMARYEQLSEILRALRVRQERELLKNYRVTEKRES